MIEGISNVIGRMQEISARIDEIKALGQNQTVNPVIGNTDDQNKTQNPDQQNFKDILNQVMLENKTLPGLTSDTSSLDEGTAANVNTLVGSNNDNSKLLELLYKNIQSSKQPGDIPGIISEASQKFGVDESLIKAVINQESGFNKEAVSNKGAMGLMQLMPRTAELLGVNSPYDPRENIMGGTKYLKMLMDRYDNNLDKSLAAYNAGPEAVDRADGIPSIPETQNYVKMVLKYYNDYKQFSQPGGLE